VVLWKRLLFAVVALATSGTGTGSGVSDLTTNLLLIDCAELDKKVLGL
jgi:hypothetical protein